MKLNITPRICLITERHNSPRPVFRNPNEETEIGNCSLQTAEVYVNALKSELEEQILRLRFPTLFIKKMPPGVGAFFCRWYVVAFY